MPNIHIKCSSCGQQFNVSDAYLNKTVECGACDTRFKVTGAVIIKDQTKYYPGEKKKVEMGSFNKIASSAVPSENTHQAPTTLGTKQNHKVTSPGYGQPPSARRTISVVGGIVLLLVFILIFALGTQPDGMLHTIDSSKRIILAGFITILASLLIITGMWSKKKAVLTSLILGGGLLSIPFIFPYQAPVSNTDNVTDLNVSFSFDEPVSTEQQAEKLKKYQQQIGFTKIQSIRQDSGTPNKIKALIVKDMGPHTDTVLNYLEDKLKLSDRPSNYNRTVDDLPASLLVFESDISTEELVTIAKRFSIPEEMNDIRTQLDVVEVRLDDRKLEDNSLAILEDENHPEFFTANYEELTNISKERRIDAIRRLGLVKREILNRADTVKQLASMLDNQTPDISNAAIKTLTKWSNSQYNAHAEVKNYAISIQNEKNFPSSVMEYLIFQKVPDITQILSQQWLTPNGHITWENLIQQAGSQGETVIINTLPKSDSAHLKSASSVLSKIGTSRSIPALTSALKRADKEDAKYLKATIDEIKSRR